MLSWERLLIISARVISTATLVILLSLPFFQSTLSKSLHVEVATQEIKFQGRAIKKQTTSGPVVSWLVSVDKSISGPHPCKSPIEVVIAGGVIQNGYVDPNIKKGDRVEVYGRYYADPEHCTVDLPKNRHYIKKISGPEENKRPVACFSYSPDSPKVGDTITFDASCSRDPDGWIKGFKWDFNQDGSPDAYGKKATYSFSSNGSHRVCLTVRDNDGATNSTCKDITVGAVEELSLHLFDPEIDGFKVKINGVVKGASGPPKWNWGDGTVEQHWFANTHTYSEAGTYTVRVTACNAAGRCITKTKTVTVKDTKPEPKEIKFTGIVIKYKPRKSGSGGWWVIDVEEIISGPQPCTNTLHVWVGPNTSGHVDSNIKPSAKAEVYGKYVEKNQACVVGLPHQRYYIKIISEPEENKPPEARFSFNPDNPKVEETVNFDASRSSDPDGWLKAYRWDFNNDGSTDASGRKVPHRFSSEGGHRVCLTVEDNDGATDSTCKDITIGATEELSLVLFEPEVDGYTVKVNGVVKGASGPPKWDWGNGTVENSWFASTHTYSNPGTYAIEVTACNEAGKCITRGKIATVPPGSFTGSNLSCNCTTDGRIRCTLDYKNQLRAKAQILFLFKKSSTEKIIDHTIVEADQGSGSVEVSFDCPPDKPGTYRVSWKAYRKCDITTPLPFKCPAWSCADILTKSNLRAAILKYDANQDGEIDDAEREQAYDDFIKYGSITKDEACAVMTFHEYGCKPTDWSQPNEEQEINCPCEGGSFTATSFTARCLDTGPYANHIEPTLSYQNDLGEEAVVVFIFKKASTGEVIGEARPYANEGSGQVKALFECPPGEPGTYRLSWKAYRASDSQQQNPVASCKPGDELDIGCPCGEPVEKPDLVIQDISWSPQNPTKEDTITIKTKVKNQGSVDAGSFQASLAIDESHFAKKKINGLAAGSTTTATFTGDVDKWSWIAQCGVKHTLKAVADSDREVEEGNENNNEYTKQIRIACEGEDKVVKIEGATDANGEFKFTAKGDNVEVRVIDESSNPVANNKIRAVHTGTNIIVHTYDPDGKYFPGFHVKSSPSAETTSQQTVEPEQAGEILVTIGVLSVGLDLYEVITDPPGYERLKSDDKLVGHCVHGDWNTVMGTVGILSAGVGAIVSYPAKIANVIDTSKHAMAVIGVETKIGEVLSEPFHEVMDEEHHICTFWTPEEDPSERWPVWPDQFTNIDPKAVIKECSVSGLEVTCDGSDSWDYDGSITKYEWDFGDGEKGYGEEATHTYNEPGSYKIKLTVTDGYTEPYPPYESGADSVENWVDVGGEGGTGCIEGTVMGSGKPGELEDYPLEGATVTVLGGPENISKESSPTGDDGYYRITDLPPTRDRGTEARYTVRASAGENYSMEVEEDVSVDAGSLCAEVDFTLEWMGTLRPVACFNATPASGPAPLTVDFDSSCSSGEIDSYHWEFGDGNTSSAQNPSYTYHDSNSYTVKLTVEGPGGEDTETKAIGVQEENHPPILSNGKVRPPTGSAGETEFKFSVVYKDEDGDEPSVHLLRIEGWQPAVDKYLTMHKESGDIKTGAVYSYVTTLPAAKDYQYWFEFESKGDLVEEPPYGEEPFDNLKVTNNQLTVTSTCPVDLAVTDPDGLVVDKESSQIPEATYTEKDLNGDGDPDDQVVISNRKTGDYEVQVIPEPRAKPDDTYSLKVSVGGEAKTLANEKQIKDIPDQPYKYTSQKTTLAIRQALDKNNNNLIDDPEILKATSYWINDQKIPGIGETIDDETMQELIAYWKNRKPIDQPLGGINRKRLQAELESLTRTLKPSSISREDIKSIEILLQGLEDEKQSLATVSLTLDEEEFGNSCQADSFAHLHFSDLKREENILSIIISDVAYPGREPPICPMVHSPINQVSKAYKLTNLDPGTYTFKVYFGHLNQPYKLLAEKEFSIAEGSDDFTIDQVYNLPNPFSGGTKFIAEGEGIESIKVKVYDLSGLQVYDSGWRQNQFEWHGKTSSGENLANGVYLYVVLIRGVTGEVKKSQVKKLLYLK